MRRRLRAAAQGVVGGAFVVRDELVVTGRLVAVVLDDLTVVEVVDRALAVVVVRPGREVVPGGPVVDGLISEPAEIVNRPSARPPGGPVRRTRYSPRGFAEVAR